MLGVFAEFFYDTSEAGPTRRLHFGLTSNGRADLYGASCRIRVDKCLKLPRREAAAPIARILLLLIIHNFSIYDFHPGVELKSLYMDLDI